MKMFVAGEWIGSNRDLPVVAPYSGEVVDTVPSAGPKEAELALTVAGEGAAAMAALTGFERNEILGRAADLLAERIEEFARVISLEEGKPIAESRVEVARCPDLMRLSAFEGTQLRGETLPLDAAANGDGKFGVAVRVPCGVVLAVTPFNYPLLLVLHKVGPALAAGNAVVLKPARQTPLTALKLTEVLLEAGLPELGLQCITGAGSDLGPLLCADPRVRKISFTGSADVGEDITKIAGIKRVSLELGSNSPLIVLATADLDQVAQAIETSAYSNAGQTCISTQRVLIDRRVYPDLLDMLAERVSSIQLGDPFAEATRVSAMISDHEARRVAEWVDEAIRGGARLVAGGDREGAMFAPTVVADVQPRMRISCKELFGPVVAVTPVENVDEAITLANDSEYGLAAGIFTDDIDVALRFAREAQVGNVHINGTPTWRADLMPYGGIRRSGIGNEGPRYAVQEMTEIKTVVFH